MNYALYVCVFVYISYDDMCIQAWSIDLCQRAKKHFNLLLIQRQSIVTGIVIYYFDKNSVI